MSEDLQSASSYLLAELRRARMAAGLSQEDLGKAINYSSSLISAVENGQRPPTPEYLMSVDDALGTGGQLLRCMVSIDQAPAWFRDWLVIEREATLLRWFEPLVIPGLLQTESYAHAIIAGAGLLDSAEVARLVAARMERRAVLTGPRPPTLIAVLDEGILHRQVGSAAVMAAQCDHLLHCAEQPHIRIHLVPSDAGAYAGLAGPFVLAKGQDFETAHLDGPWQALIVDRSAAMHSLLARWEEIRGEALPRGSSIDLLKKSRKAWQT